MYQRIALAVFAFSAFAHAGGRGAQNDVSCSGGGTFNYIDLLFLLNSTDLNAFSDPISDPFALNDRSSQSFNQGTAQLCIANDFLFDNTHIFLHDLAQGGFNVASQCCSLNSTTCGGGTVTVNGDSGLSTILQVTTSSNACGGSIQADTTGALTLGEDIGAGIGKFFGAIASLFNGDDD